MEEVAVAVLVVDDGRSEGDAGRSKREADCPDEEDDEKRERGGTTASQRLNDGHIPVTKQASFT